MTGSQDGVFESGVREPVPRDRETAARFAPGFACGRDIGFRREVRQERDNRLGAEPGRVAVAMKANVAFDPVDVRLLSADAVMLQADDCAYLVAQPGGRLNGCRSAFRTP